MALFEATFQMRYFSQTCINRWNYVSSGSAGTAKPAVGLATAMGFVPDASSVFPVDTIFDQYRQQQPTTVIYESILVRNVYDSTDFYSAGFPAGTVGLITDPQPMSPVLAYGLRTNRVDLDIRRGFKRIVGVVEGTVTAGGALTSGTLTGLQVMADLFSATLSFTDGGASLTFKPAVCKKFRYPTTGGRFAYKYFEDEAEQLSHTAQGVTWEIFQEVRTQNSRQYGRGI